MALEYINSLKDDLSRGRIIRLGFGGANLYGGRSRTASLKLVETAVECGITHFDLARLYGHGDAESVIGQLPAATRNKLRLVSKAGILPVEMSFGWRLRAKAHALSRMFPAPPILQPRFNMFSQSELRKSVETTLQKLRVDCLDMLLLHECKPKNAESPETLGLLQDLRREGKIRAFGTATSPETTLAISRKKTFDVLQFKSGLEDDTLAKVRSSSDALTITHSHLSDAADRLPDRRALSSPAYEHNGARFTLGECLIASALNDNPDGMVLFSTSKPERIAEMVRILDLDQRAHADMQAVAKRALSLRPHDSGEAAQGK